MQNARKTVIVSNEKDLNIAKKLLPEKSNY